jgi:hypothetical protein
MQRVWAKRRAWLKARARPGSWPWLVFALVLSVYLANGDFLPGHDASPNVYLAVNLVQRGTLVFTPETTPSLFAWEIRTTQGWQPFDVTSSNVSVEGHSLTELVAGGHLRSTGTRYTVTASQVPEAFVSTFPPGPGVFAAPLFGLIQLLTGDVTATSSVTWYASKLAASSFVAGSAAFVFATALAFVTLRRALFIALAYAFGTCVFTLSSQALWTHGPDELFLAMGAYYFVAKHDDRAGALSGFAFACATTCRPPSGLVLVACAGYLAWRRPRSLVWFLGGAALPLALYAAYNTHYLGSPFAFGQTRESDFIALQKTGSHALWDLTLWRGAAGLLFSPSRGLLVFSPVVVCGLWGLVATPRPARDPARFDAFRPISFGTVSLLLVAFAWFDWWGGWSFGYRPIVDTMPLLAVLSIPVIDRVLDGAARFALLGCLVWSIGVQCVGAFAYDLGWNTRVDGYDVELTDGTQSHVATQKEALAIVRATPGARVSARSMDIDTPAYRSRLWSLSDNEIAYYVANFVKARASKHALMRSWLAGGALR